MTKIIWIFAALMLCVDAAHGTSITRSELPAGYCMTPRPCPAVLNSKFDAGGMSVFFLPNHADRFLIRYSIFEPSDGSLSGYLWLDAARDYDLTQQEHAFTLLIDYAHPSPRDLWSQNPTRNLDFTLTTHALLAGEGHFFLTCCTEGTQAPGDLNQHSLWPCAATLCTAALDFYLLNLRYQQEGDTALLTFTSADDRALLFRQGWSYQHEGHYSSKQQEYYAAPPVPLPGAFWLFACGLVAGALSLTMGQVKERGTPKIDTPALT